MKVEVSTPIKRSGRVQQVESMFDVPRAADAALTFEVPDQMVATAHDPDTDGWHIGLVVGPSATGKTTIAQELWPDAYVSPDTLAWSPERAVVDGIAAPIRDTVQMLTSVGFGSPPAWLRPYHVLSTGEQFRAQLARVLLESDGLAVVDEFSSVVDRQVAQFGSAATAKAVRRQGSRFVAVTCHHDVLEWLNPDWVYRPDSGQIEWPRGSLQRPEVVLEVRRVSRDAWTVFGPHHYLSADLHVAARCVGAFWNGECVSFCAWYRFPHPRAKNIMLIHRVVTLPDYQGLGIGSALLDYVAQLLASEGERARITTAHPAFIATLKRSPRWRQSKGQNNPSRSRKPKRLVKQHSSIRKLSTRTFEYVGLGATILA